MAIEFLPVPSVVSFIQIISSVIAIYVLKLFNVKVDPLEWDKIKSYSVYVVAFVAAIYANMQALQVCNVETVIVFRACSPISVSVVEYIFMNRELPSMRSSLSLGTVALGALIYCMCDSEFALKGLSAYSWAIAYFFLITFEMTYGKKLTSSVKMDSVWGPVLYCNLLAAVPMFLLGYLAGDYEGLYERLVEMPTNGMLVLLFSCVAGTLIGYTGWLCRGMVSGASYTLIGVVNKFVTILLNVLLWDKHSSPMGLFAVCICLLGARPHTSFYSPLACITSSMQRVPCTSRLPEGTSSERYDSTHPPCFTLFHTFTLQASSDESSIPLVKKLTQV